MVAKPPLSASPLKAFELFDPEERASFLDEVDATPDDLLERFTASDLLIWIVRHRSTFIRMAVEITRLLGKIEASLKGNIEFIVSVVDGREVDLVFGPQVRELLLAAESWIDHAALDLQSRIGTLDRNVSAFCRDARTTEVERDSDMGGMLRDMSDRHPDPFEHERLTRAADFLKSYETEVHPSDIAAMAKVRDAARRVDARVHRILEADTRNQAVFSGLRQIAANAEQAHRRIAGYQSYHEQPPRPRLDERRANRICRSLDELESLAHQAKRLDETGSAVMAAMGLMLWKERWRIYELWVLCFLCLQLTVRSDQIDPMGRIQAGRWTLKYTRDAKPILAFRFGDRWIDVFYQYFERGADQANMPDIAVRDRLSGTWLAIVDPKMGETYRHRDLSEVCLRYARAFSAGTSIIASYFPEEGRTEELGETAGAMICHGLRPGGTAELKSALVRACSNAGIIIGSKTVVILADVSGSMAGLRAAVTSAIARAGSSDPEIDLGASIVACFNDRWTDLVTLGSYLSAPRLPEASGSTDTDGALRKAIEHLAATYADGEIWLFSDGQSFGVPAAEFEAARIVLNVFVPRNCLASGIRELCAATGGAAHELESLSS